MTKKTATGLILAIILVLATLKSVNSAENSKTRKKELIYYKKTTNPLKTNLTFPIENRCKGLEDLLTTADECKFDPDDYLDVPQIIRRHGYPSETHVIQTEDGYLLKVHRVSGNKSGEKGGQPVLLQHGLLGSSADWVLNGDTALAFYLADNGYDVWLGNARGNVYSKAHISLPPYSPQFWNFSWHEMATKDLPAVLYHISNTTGKPGEILYIGHSMGTTMSFVLASVLPQVAKNIKLIVSLAPAAYMTHLRSPLRYLAPFANDINWIISNLGISEFNPSNKVLRFLSYECEKKNYTKKICENILFVFAGFNEKEFNITMLPKVLSHDPAGTSTKTILHYAQEIKADGNFQQFDYGPKGNMQKYGTLTPPQYKLLNIKRPVFLMYAENDILTSYIDVERLSKNLTNLAGMYKIPSDTFGHIDFIFGNHAYEYVYQPLLKVLRNYTMESERQEVLALSNI